MQVPADPLERAALGAALLKQGRLNEGFRLFDAWRDVPGQTNCAPRLPLPIWRGQDVRGKHVLIWSEHGLGDQMMYARFAKVLVDRGAEVRWACPQSLASLLAGMGVIALPDDQPFELAGVDYYCPSSALPLGFNLSLSPLPSDPYFTATPEPRRGRIGIVPTGGPANTARSLPPGLAKQLLSLPGALDLRPEATGASDFRQTARLIAGLDVVVSVDTAVAHLAGALGTPVLVLLPFDADWRWLAGRSDSPWYPSARLFRQDSPGEWGPVIDAVTAALGSRCL